MNEARKPDSIRASIQPLSEGLRFAVVEKAASGRTVTTLRILALAILAISMSVSAAQAGHHHHHADSSWPKPQHKLPWDPGQYSTGQEDCSYMGQC